MAMAKDENVDILCHLPWGDMRSGVWVMLGQVTCAKSEQWEKKIKDELKLTPEQVQKYDALNSEYNPKFDAIMNDASLTKDAQKEKKMALKKEKEAKMNEFLTPEQQTKYRELVDKKKKEMEKQ